jgi:DMSO/TMAO reductase YedYZ molybdopterin-dependent catalytic subunit
LCPESGNVSDVRETTDRTTRQPAGDGGGGRWLRRALGALSGLLAAFAALAAAELVAALVGAGSPITAVGGQAVDATPPALKNWAIREFGTNDKVVLQLGIVGVLALFAVAIGLLALRHRRIGAAAALLFGVVGAAAAVSRPDAETGAALPSVVGALVAAGVLYLLAPRLGAAPPAEEAPAADAHEGGFDRRRFVVTASAAAVASAAVGYTGMRLGAGDARQARASRGSVRLPEPSDTAAAVPEGADLDVRGLSPFFTPNKDFYRVDTALRVPKVDATTWRLQVHGKGVRKPLTLSFDDLLHRDDLVERDITLTCVSNEVGGPYVGNARWIGVPLAGVLRDAGVRPPSQGGPADQLVSRSVDGMTIGTPVESVLDGRDALLAVGMNGEPLPFDHGFPVRMVVPGLYGYVSACKWIEDIELSTFDSYDAYWVNHGWARKAPIKTESRIDTPKPFADLKAGTRIPVAGVAWAQHRGIDRVEVQVDDGPWEQARLGAEDSEDTWRQWVHEWTPTPGTHTLRVRATDGTGQTQTKKRAMTIPDGASGRHSVVVKVS